MRFRRRRSLLSFPTRRGLEKSVPLKGQLWTRSESALREPDVHPGWRGLAAGVAVLECALLAWLWFGPALAVQNIQVTGARHLSAAQVAAAVGLTNTASVLSIDGEADRHRLMSQVWVRTASVEPQLPGGVMIRISEWQPVAEYHPGKSTRLFYLSDQAIVLGPAKAAAGLVDVQGPAGSDPRIGAQALDPELLTALVNIQRGFPTLLGQEVAGFVFDSCGDLTLLAKRGWKVYFGRVLTPEEFSTLNDKLTALKAIAGKGNVDYSSGDLEYVNVMNAAEPAVGYKSREPKPPSPSPGATPAPSPTPVTTCR